MTKNKAAAGESPVITERSQDTLIAAQNLKICPGLSAYKINDSELQAPFLALWIVSEKV